ncbi:flagellar filament capping protein FliD [Paenibacillus oenotherae]|uniref:Flagellar hook-associated protein 2 n=2 Tax=Paenibacillus oenotherae TaxID=1435645 RepID=A0ABS7D4Z2_9BACL|nr:flagellar filament capping protein FliD [Paenibacillus oenotherae]
MLDKLMEYERLPYDRMKEKKTNLGSEQNIFRTINTKLSTLQTAVSDLLLGSNFNLSSATSSDEKVAKVTAAEGATTGNFDVTVNTLAKSHAIKSANITSASTYLKGSVFTIDRAGFPQISIDTSVAAAGSTNGEVLEYIKNQINSQDSGLSASIISVSDTEKVLLLSSKETGLDNKMKLSGGTGGIELGGTSLAGLGISDVDGANQTQAADNATLTVNGVDITRSSNKINDVISGVSLNLLSTGASQVNIAKDTDKIASKIEAFVTAYNDAVNMVRNNLTKPTDKTKMNPLQGDAMLKDVSDKLYTIFNRINANAADIAGGASPINMMSIIGLEIDKGITSGTLMTGKISFDKEKFKEKFNEDPNAVMDLFKRDDAVDSKDGIMQVLNTQLKEWTSTANGLMTSKIKGYDSEISVIDDRMEAMDFRLQMRQDKLKKQFTAMEVALSKLKSQQSWMTSQLAALQTTAKS